MESHYQEPHNSVEGGEHIEKKPVMARMKDKMNKIKNTINKKAHGHQADADREHEHDNDVMSEEAEGYEEEEEEERVAEPEVRGAPVYDGEEAGHFAGGRGENLGPGKDANYGEAEVLNSGPKENWFGTNEARDKSQLLNPSTAAGGDEVGESPLLSSFQAMTVSDKPKGAEVVLKSPPTGTQFSPDKPLQDTPIEGTEEQKRSSYTDKISSTATANMTNPQQDTPKEGTKEQKSSSYRGKISSIAAATNPQQDTPKDGTDEQKSSSYTDKVSSTATATKDAAVSAAIGSAEYSKKIASTVYVKVSEAGTAIMGRGVTQEEKNDNFKTGQPEKGVSVKEKGVSVKEYGGGKLRPGDEDKALSEAISDALYTKKQEAAGVPPEDAKGSSSEESGSGKGIVEKIKGAVTSWI